ncbi:hypothetical protein PSAB6_340153 [Paraburkholderia sabiae]|nr:hypothetical protein PSAB6_340153 [Paraburkholderia sabiae]
MAEAQKIVRVRGGQDREIGLRVVAAMAGRRTAEVAMADSLAEFEWSHGVGVLVRVALVRLL